MPVFEYHGLSAEGKKIKGIIDAPTPRMARTKLRAMEIFPVDIREEIQMPQKAEDPLTSFSSGYALRMSPSSPGSSRPFWRPAPLSYPPSMPSSSRRTTTP